MNSVDVKRRQIEIASLVAGSITLLIFGKMLGDNGVAYVAVAMECFLFFWSLTGSAVADVLGRILRIRSAKGQYKNVAKMHRSALAIETLAGLAVSVLMFVSADKIAESVFRTPYCASLIMILAPAVFLRTESAALLAYFQGEGTELPAVIVAAARQVGILAFGLLFGNLSRNYGLKVSGLLKQPNFAAMYGGMGIALAVSVTEGILLLFLFLVYRGSRRNERGSIERMRAAESFGSQVHLFYSNLFPSIIAAVLQILPLILGVVFYQKVSGSDAALELYGVFYGKYLALCGIVILSIHALILGACSRAAYSQRKDELRLARNHFWGGLHIGIMQSLFWMMIFFVFSPHLSRLFCQTNQSVAEEMFRKGAVLILFVVVGRYFIELTRQMRGKYLVLGILALYDIIYTVSVAILLDAGDNKIITLMNAGLLTEGICMAVAGALVCYKIRCGIDWLNGLVVPVVAVCITGLVLTLVDKVLTPHLGDLTALIINVLIGAVLYGTILFFARNFRGQDADYMPGGNLMRKLGQLLHLR